jgi:hypothetical protein
VVLAHNILGTPIMEVPTIPFLIISKTIRALDVGTEEEDVEVMDLFLPNEASTTPTTMTNVRRDPRQKEKDEQTTSLVLPT